MRFEVLVVVNVKISAFWAMTLCTAVRIYWLLEEPSVFILTVELVLLRKWKSRLQPKHRDISTRIHGVT
jgi:hypothetical protein